MKVLNWTPAKWDDNGETYTRQITVKVPRGATVQDLGTRQLLHLLPARLRLLRRDLRQPGQLPARQAPRVGLHLLRWT
jgi:hypothetical protein